MALSVQPGSQTNQWSVQPPQQQPSFQQPAQNTAMPFVSGQYVAPIPPYTPNPQEVYHKAPLGQVQGPGQNTGQMVSTQQVAPFTPNASFQAQQKHQPQPQQAQQQQQRPSLENEDFFGSFSSMNRRTSSLSIDSVRPTPEIQTNENDNVSMLSKSTRSINRRLSPFEDPTFAPAPPRIKGIENARDIAAHAPPDVDPLPDISKVAHSGFCLARISFRSILIKKWKQVFWVTYGTSKLLFFRSNSDFQDWVSNPYLTKVQRDFLVKLEVDLVEDASKMNVKGYQATNLRCKSYQNSMLHQFKLERWMDYGPTIAAAFASQRESDVYNLRTIISEMMKMHPQQQVIMQNRSQEIHHTRTYDSAAGYNDSERGYYDTDDAGRHYISGSASAGAISDGGSVRSSKTVRSYGVADKVGKAARSSARSVGSAAKSVGSAAKSVGSGAKSVGSAAKSVGSGLGNAAKTVGKGAGTAAKTVGRGAGTAAKSVGSAVGAAAKTVGNAAGSVRHIVKK